MPKPFIFYRNTKDRVSHEQESEVMDQMDDDKESVDYEEFAENVEHGDVVEQLGYSDDLPLSEDWHVGFYKSLYGGLPCYLLVHSECDFIFLRPKDAQMLHEQFDPGMSELEWRRHTEFGENGAVDPR